MLESYARCDTPVAAVDLSCNIQCDCFCVAHTVGLAARRAITGHDQVTVFHAIAVFILEAVFLVPVIPEPRCQENIGFTGREQIIVFGLNTTRVVVAVVIAQDQGIIRGVGPTQIIEFRHIGHRVLEHAADAGAVDALQFVPIAREIVVVPGCGEIP